MSNQIFLRLNTLKGSAKVPTVDLLRLNTQRCTKTAFELVKGMSIPGLFIWESPILR